MPNQGSRAVFAAVTVLFHATSAFADTKCDNYHDVCVMIQHCMNYSSSASKISEGLSKPDGGHIVWDGLQTCHDLYKNHADPDWDCFGTCTSGCMDIR